MLYKYVYKLHIKYTIKINLMNMNGIIVFLKLYTVVVRNYLVFIFIIQNPSIITDVKHGICNKNGSDLSCISGCDYKFSTLIKNMLKVRKCQQIQLYKRYILVQSQKLRFQVSLIKKYGEVKFLQRLFTVLSFYPKQSPKISQYFPRDNR